MASVFIDKLQIIMLTEEEDEVVIVGATHREKILEQCSLSLFGCFLTKRPYNQRATKELLRFVWKFGTDLRIVDVGDGLFQFNLSLLWKANWSGMAWGLFLVIFHKENHPKKITSLFREFLIAFSFLFLMKTNQALIK